jgi:hypothetical protein
LTSCIDETNKADKEDVQREYFLTQYVIIVSTIFGIFLHPFFSHGIVLLPKLGLDHLFRGTTLPFLFNLPLKMHFANPRASCKALKDKWWTITV